jgi:uncharacterized membrane protein (UPF0136 family)
LIRLPAIARAGSLQSGLLLAALVAVMVSAFNRFDPGSAGAILSGVFYFTVFSVAGYLIGARRNWLIAYAVVAVPAIVVGVAAVLLPSLPFAVEVARDLFALVLHVHLVLLVFRFSLFDRSASRADRVTAGICGYLIIGLMWANLFSLHELYRPGEIVDSSGKDLADSGGFLYFSLVTLTSTGYGDVLAQSSSARLLASLEAIVGTLYLAVFISTLVGSQEKSEIESDSVAIKEETNAKSGSG